MPGALMSKAYIYEYLHSIFRSGLADYIIPRPSAIGPRDAAKFEFVGVLLGIAIRTLNALPLRLPPLVWKRLLQMRTSRRDLEAIDSHVVRIVPMRVCVFGTGWIHS